MEEDNSPIGDKVFPLEPENSPRSELNNAMSQETHDLRKVKLFAVIEILHKVGWN